MVSSVLLCFRPFSLGVQRFCPLSTHACGFYSFLSEELKRLEQSLGEGPVSLRWSAEAMNLLKRMQIELLALFKNCKLPIAFTAEEDDWFDQYMQETAALLDLCNSLKSAVSGISRRRMVIELAMQKIARGDPTSLDDVEFERAEAKTVRVVGLQIEFQGGNRNRADKSIAGVMLAAKCTVVVVSVLLVSAVVATPLSIDVGGEELASKFPQLKPFVEMLEALVARFHEKAISKPKKKGSRPVLAEHEMVDITIGELKAQAMRGVGGEDGREKFMKSAELLRTSSDQLKEGIEMFGAVVDEVFEVAMKGRNEMLGVFRDGVLSAG